MGYHDALTSSAVTGSGLAQSQRQVKKVIDEGYEPGPERQVVEDSAIGNASLSAHRPTSVSLTPDARSNFPPSDRHRPSVVVRGLVVDDQTRCEHYATTLDVIALRFWCCREYYPCHACHEATAGHAAEVWPLSKRDQRAVLCGVCHHELTVHEYLGVHGCPECSARFNPGCRLHIGMYFEVEPSA